MKLGQMEIPPPDGKMWPTEWVGSFELEIRGTEIIVRLKDRKSDKTVMATFNTFGVPFINVTNNAI